MTPEDKELLKLAAKAARIKIKKHGKIFVVNSLRHGIEEWNALEDDYDAFALMVRLDTELQKEKDPHAAARRKIVMAAAELIKEKK